MKNKNLPKSFIAGIVIIAPVYNKVEELYGIFAGIGTGICLAIIINVLIHALFPD
jgi:hypothetical protein